jgi:hypothetical protein
MRRNDHSSRGFKRRKTNTREKEISFLIITEDTRSSKLYLEGVIREVQEAYKGSIVTNIPRDSKEDLEEAGIGPVDNVVEVSEEKQQTSTELPMPSKVKDSEEAQGISNCEEDEDSKEPVDISRDSMVRGCGMGTSRLLEEAKKIKAETLTPFDSCWLVFDKDDFDDFNKAIKEAEDAGFHVAWSNESFELWYLLHFTNKNIPTSREKYKKALEKEIKRYKPSFEYDKGSSTMHSILTMYGKREQAIKNAERLQKKYLDTDWSSHNPCTYMDKLIKAITDPDMREEIRNKSDNKDARK